MKLDKERWGVSEKTDGDKESLAASPKVSADDRRHDIITWDPQKAVARFTTDDAIVFCQILMHASEKQLEAMFPRDNHGESGGV